MQLGLWGLLALIAITMGAKAQDTPFAVHMFIFAGAALLKRKEPHFYVANWFYLSFIVTIAMLHLINNLSIPVSIFGSKIYAMFSGVQDALTQWWYGHNAAGFFLTAGFKSMAPSSASDIGRTAAEAIFMGNSVQAVAEAIGVSRRTQAIAK